MASGHCFNLRPKLALLATTSAALFAIAGVASEFVNKPTSLDLQIATINQSGFSAECLKRIDIFFAAEIKKRVPGGAVGIVRDRKLVYLKAHGCKANETGSLGLNRPGLCDD